MDRGEIEVFDVKLAPVIYDYPHYESESLRTKMKVTSDLWDAIELGFKNAIALSELRDRLKRSTVLGLAMTEPITTSLQRS